MQNLQHDIAVIGVAFMLPGATRLSEFEHMVFNGLDAYSVLDVNSGKENLVTQAGYLHNWELFDYKLYGISLRDSLILDPQHRIFMQCCWGALENAGYNPRSVPSRVGVFSTTSDTDYANVIRNYLNIADKYYPLEIELGSNKEQQSLRVSHSLNLCGPSYVVQSACSSGLLTIHSAMQELLMGGCDIAIVGGSSLPFPLHSGYEYKEGMNLSKTGRICSFDNAADGMVSGFGSVVFVLKQLVTAINDRDQVLAILKTSSVNNDGNKKSTYTSPSKVAIAENINNVLKKANLKPEDINLIEAHGSGTYIGDVIEAAALSQVFFNANKPDESVAVSSVKSSIGHLDTVAGLAGLLRAIVQVQNKCIAPATNFISLNKNISFNRTPLYVPKELRMLDGQVNCIVNSLGIGGTNCALIVQSANFTEQCITLDSEHNQIVHIGAETKDRLILLIKSLVIELHEYRNMDFINIVFTLNRRTINKPYIIQFAVNGIDELIKKLSDFLAGENASYVQCAEITKNIAVGKVVGLSYTEIDRTCRVDLSEYGNYYEQCTVGDYTQKLSTIWKSGLLIPQVESNTSFRNEGGHSMLSLTMVDEINRVFGVQVDMDWFDRYDTFAEQLKSIYDLILNNNKAINIKNARTNRQLVKLMKLANATPTYRIILLHASISGYEVYKPLVEHLGDNIEVYAVDSYNLYAVNDDLIEDKTELVKLYISQIRNEIIDHTIPTWIGGWSLGGLMANMVAEYLVQDYVIRGVIAIDSVIYNPRYESLFGDDALEFFISDVDRLLGHRTLNKLATVFACERIIAKSITRRDNNLPLLNIIATKCKKDISNSTLLNQFINLKLDNGWGVLPEDFCVFIESDHEQIIGLDNVGVIANYINQFMGDVCTSI